MVTRYAVFTPNGGLVLLTANRADVERVVRATANEGDFGLESAAYVIEFNGNQPGSMSSAKIYGGGSAGAWHIE